MKIYQKKIIACPKCKNLLDWNQNYGECKNCNKKYQIEKGIVRFLNDNDKFYENIYTRQIHYIPGKNLLKNWMFFYLVQGGILGEIKKVIKPKDKVLDIGCAGGIKWLGKYTKTIGLDLSFASLIKALQCYDGAIQANIENLPLKNSSFDLIYGSYIFEHLSPKVKENFLKEAHRVLNPQGKLILQFDTLSNNWLTCFALKDLKAYKRGFIDIDNHIGLEPLSIAITQLKKNGFKIIRIIKFGTTFIQYEPSYNWLNISYGESVYWVKILGKITHKIVQNKHSAIILEFGITLFDRLINFFSKNDLATRAIIVAEKISKI